jgi:hypothetical protein
LTILAVTAAPIAKRDVERADLEAVIMDLL